MTKPTEKDREKAVQLATVIVESDAVTAIAAVAQALADERAAQREADAQKCDAVKERLELSHEPEAGISVGELIEIADECAPAIRTEAQP